MYKGPAEAAEFCLRLREEDLSGVEVVVCPPYVSLTVSVQLLAGTELAVAAQNVHWEQEGAYTGEISAGMLLELGVYGAIVGHSERRQYFGETDETTAQRARAALSAGLFVIACVGETEEEREGGVTEDVLRRQVSLFEPDNAEELLGRPDVDGALVGGASLELESFMAICRAGASTNS